MGWVGVGGLSWFSGWRRWVGFRSWVGGGSLGCWGDGWGWVVLESSVVGFGGARRAPWHRVTKQPRRVAGLRSSGDGVCAFRSRRRWADRSSPITPRRCARGAHRRRPRTRERRAARGTPRAVGNRRGVVPRRERRPQQQRSSRARRDLDRRTG